MMLRLTCPDNNATVSNNVTHHIQNAPNGTILLQYAGGKGILLIRVLKSEERTCTRSSRILMHLI